MNMIIKRFRKEWSLTKSQNFNFYIRPINKTILRKEIEEADKFVNSLKKRFKIKSSKRIDYFIIEDKIELSRFTKMKEGVCRAESEKWRIWSNKPNHFHEITHVWIFNFLGKPNYSLCEGLATYFGDLKEKSSREKIIKLKRRLFLLRTLCDDSKFRELDWGISYAQSGYLIEFLISKFSFEKFVKLYMNVKWRVSIKEVIKEFEKILDIKFSELEREFLESLE